MSTLDKMKALGCSNIVRVMMAYQTYLELIAVQLYADIMYYYDEELDIVYLQGRRNDSRSTFVPVHCSLTLSLNWIQAVRNKLYQDNEESIILVIRDADSGCVHYKLSRGLIMPPATSNRLLRRGGNEKSRKKQKTTK